MPADIWLQFPMTSVLNLLLCLAVVRYQHACLVDPTIFDSGMLPPAMDLVLSAIEKPAVVLIDTW